MKTKMLGQRSITTKGIQQVGLTHQPAKTNQTWFELSWHVDLVQKN